MTHAKTPKQVVLEIYGTCTELLLDKLEAAREKLAAAEASRDRIADSLAGAREANRDLHADNARLLREVEALRRERLDPGEAFADNIYALGGTA